jgi:NTP pyrophosphatase (non-canonical NTP hydrolase)
MSKILYDYEKEIDFDKILSFGLDSRMILTRSGGRLDINYNVTSVRLFAVKLMDYFNKNKLSYYIDEVTGDIFRGTEPTKLTFKEYSKHAAESDKVKNNRLPYFVLGLNGESGEVAEKYKKIIRDDDNHITGKHKIEIEKELGDVLWYVERTANEIGSSLEEVALKNIEKLKDRLNRNKISGSGDNR